MANAQICAPLELGQINMGRPSINVPAPLGVMQLNGGQKLNLFLKLLSMTDPREKMLKLTQFSISFVMYMMRQKEYVSASKYAYSRKLTKYISSSRRVFKFLRVIESIKAFSRAHHEQDKTIRRLLLAQNCLSVVTDCLYDFATISFIGLLPDNPKYRFRNIMRIHDFVWLVFAILCLLNAYFEIRRKQKLMAELQIKVICMRSPGQCTCNPEIQQVNDTITMKRIAVIKYIHQIFQAAGGLELSWGPQYPGIMYCGMMSSLVAIHSKALKELGVWEQLMDFCYTHNKTGVIERNTTK